MKKEFIVLAFLLASFMGVSAQQIEHIGPRLENGKVSIDNPLTTITVFVKEEKSHFNPGVYARYAQKYLGVRASLAAKDDATLKAAIVLKGEKSPFSVSEGDTVTEEFPLLENRLDGRALSLEDQAKATADMIFSIRKHRVDLVSGEAGEHVFGAGLKDAIEELNRLEKYCLELFYGKTTVEESIKAFDITPSSTEKDYVVCRFRQKFGLVPENSLTDDAVMLHFEPSADVISLPFREASPKEKNVDTFKVSVPTTCSLTVGADDLCSVKLPVFQYGRTALVSVYTK